MASAPGYRDSYSGGPVKVGNGGYSWSSAIGRTNGVFLDFYAQHLSPNSVGNRGHGLQLRCLSE
ncbi:hypothetical protein [uncultured Rikenella sp.]|uniref:hypothetical protein n=1 Tax=uncultured Rikenella sp. TaxID=368003 RepID=UPI00263885AB|nr:hypothetical protein [uncultured Rikenella sp.]